MGPLEHYLLTELYALESSIIKVPMMIAKNAAQPTSRFPALPSLRTIKFGIHNADSILINTSCFGHQIRVQGAGLAEPLNQAQIARGTGLTRSH